MAQYDDILLQLQAIRDERRLAANTATRVGEALISMLDYAENAPYVRTDREQKLQYLLTLLAGAIIGEGRIKLNSDGSITCESIKVEGSAVFHELVYNRQNILEGDTYFTDRATVETVYPLSSSEFLLRLRKEYNNETVTFHVNDVLRQVVNRLDTARTYYTSWYRVEEVLTDTNQIRVLMYPGEEVPGGVNYAPTEGGNVIRWGNAADEDRQQTFFVSSNDGRFLFLQGVTKPIVEDSSYSAFIGLPPDLEILKDLPVNKRQPYIFARGIIMQDVITVDYKGNPEYKARERGFWNSSEQYIRGYDEEAKGYFEDRVWHGGCLWACSVPKATVGKEPRYNNTEWVCLVGGGNMTMDIESSEGDFFRAGTQWETTLTACIYNAEMLLTEEDIGKEYVRWERTSEDSVSDKAWNNKHGKGVDGFSVTVSSMEDLPTAWTAKSKVAFSCIVEIPDGETIEVSYVIA